MAPLSDEDELKAAWRALEGTDTSHGWRTIQISTGEMVAAGRRFPENEEALVVGFDAGKVTLPKPLPQSRGFEVEKAAILGKDKRHVWIALRRLPAGRLDLFTMMAVDIVVTLKAFHSVDDLARLRLFIARIRAWQEFMRSDSDGLSPEAEVGLLGELHVLDKLLSVGVTPQFAIDSWRGPLDGLQDFSLGVGAIEVKSTASSQGFLAAVGSIDQLDDSLIRPIFVTAVRASLDTAGETLPERIATLRSRIAGEPHALANFDNLLLRAGYINAAADRYIRRFTKTPLLRVLRVSDSFPRIVRSNVALEIRSARYEVDLDLVNAPDVTFSEALSELGMGVQWN